jgi:hypothetical protein
MKHDKKRVYHVREATMVNDVAMSVSMIYATIDNQQADHQAYVVDLEGIISKQPIYVFIEPGSNPSYVSPQFVEACSLQRKKHAKSWLVYLATWTKRKVAEVIEACPLEMSGLNTQTTLNILPLGSFNVLMDMDLLTVCKERLNF